MRLSPALDRAPRARDHLLGSLDTCGSRVVVLAPRAGGKGERDYEDRSVSHARCITRRRAGARSGRAVKSWPDSDMALDTYSNDEKQATLTIMLLSIMSVIITGLIVASVLSTQSCSV